MNPLIEAGTKYTTGNVKRRDLAVGKVDAQEVAVEGPVTSRAVQQILGYGVGGMTYLPDARTGLQIYTNHAGSQIDLVANAAGQRCAIAAVERTSSSPSEGATMNLRTGVTSGSDGNRAMWVTSGPNTSTLFAVMGNRIRVPFSFTPATASADGQVGEIAWDAGHMYLCTAPNTWKRSAFTSWS